MKTLILASTNTGKLHEFNQGLSTLNYTVVGQSEYGVTSIAETALTFVENALIKARHASEVTGLPSLADDSGLEVDALHGAPGVRSARYAGEQSSAQANVHKLLQALVGQTQRRARFRCVLVYLRHSADPTPIICEGVWEGTILLHAQGEGGFGYDPIFGVPEHMCSAAQLTTQQKNVLSHRGQALRMMLERLRHDVG